MPVSAFAARRALQNPPKHINDSVENKKRTAPPWAGSCTAQKTGAHDTLKESEIHSGPSTPLQQQLPFSKSHILDIDWSSDSSDNSWKPESPEKEDVVLHGSDIDSGSGVELANSRGAVVIQGATLHPSSQAHRIYAASTHSLPSIRHSRNPYGPESQPAEVTLISCRTRIRLLGQLHGNFRRVWNYGNTFLSQNSQSTNMLQTSLDDPHRRPIATVNPCPDWQALATKFTVGTSLRPHGVLICGPKASGKSTFARLLSNTILTRPASTGSSDGLLLLDIDPGQPEFSPPGEISLLHLRSCVFSPPFTHPIPNIRAGDRLLKAHHIGSVSPRDDPDHYLRCIADLLNHYQQTISSYPSCPLIVNCSGWVGGGGLEILAELLRSPILTDIVYMSRTGPEEVHDVLETAAQKAQISFHKLTSQPSQYATRTPADLRLMQSLSYFHLDKPDENGLQWDPSIINFQKSLTLQYAGTEQVVFGIMILGDELDMKCLFDLIDGSVLGVVAIEDDSVLAVQGIASSQVYQDTSSHEDPSESELVVDGDGVTPPQSADNEVCEGQSSHDVVRFSRSNSDFSEARGALSSSGPDHPWIRRTEEELPCLFNGLGVNIPLDPSKTRSLGQMLVRGIDRENRSLHVVTPIPRTVIEGHCEAGGRIVLVRGRLDLPEWSYMEEYNAAVSSRKRKKTRGNTPRYDVGDEAESDDSGYLDVEFDMEDWARNVDWITMDQGSEGKQCKDRIWKVRRNLRDRWSGGGKSE
ncbi:MAG: hypothetical protein Q9187_000276 [Circinaria calcarea]